MLTSKGKLATIIKKNYILKMKGRFLKIVLSDMNQGKLLSSSENRGWMRTRKMNYDNVAVL